MKVAVEEVRGLLDTKCGPCMVVAKLITTMCGKLFSDRPWHHRMGSVSVRDVLRYDILWIILSYLLSLIIPEPTCFDKPDPAIVTEDCRNDSFHSVIDLVVRRYVFFNLPKECIIFIDFDTQLATVIIFRVHWAVLRPD